MNRQTPIGNQLTDEIVTGLLGDSSVSDEQCGRIIRAIVFGRKVENADEQRIVNILAIGFKKVASANEKRKKKRAEIEKRSREKRLAKGCTTTDNMVQGCTTTDNMVQGCTTTTIQNNTIQDNTIQYPPISPQGGDERDCDEDEFRDVCERMKARHPRKEQFDSLNRVMRGVLKKNPGAKLADIEGAHVSWCGTERWSDPEYAPVLVGWLKRGGWKDPVPEEKREQPVAEYEHVNCLEFSL